MSFEVKLRVVWFQDEVVLVLLLVMSVVILEGVVHQGHLDPSLVYLRYKGVRGDQKFKECNTCQTLYIVVVMRN